MRFEYKRLIGGDVVTGIVEEWHWSRNKGSWERGADFFSVHWEVQEKWPTEVRLHVESPRVGDDPVLNDLKSEIVERMLERDLASAVSKAGFTYAVGKLISRSDISRNKSTEPFRVMLPGGAPDGTIEENLMLVHEKLGSTVQAALDPYMSRLQAEFNRG